MRRLNRKERSCRVKNSCGCCRRKIVGRCKRGPNPSRSNALSYQKGFSIARLPSTIKRVNLRRFGRSLIDQPSTMRKPTAHYAINTKRSLEREQDQLRNKTKSSKISDLGSKRLPRPRLPL